MSGENAAEGAIWLVRLHDANDYIAQMLIFVTNHLQRSPDVSLHGIKLRPHWHGGLLLFHNPLQVEVDNIVRQR